MFGEYKYSVWALSVKLFLIYLGAIFINILVSIGLLGIFKEENLAWNWFIQALALLITGFILYIFSGGDGKRDIMADSANEKRAERYDGFVSEKKYDERKGFLAGLIAQSPAVILFIVWAITGSQQNAVPILLNLYYSPFFQIKQALGLNVLSLIAIVAIFVSITGLSYLSAKSYRKKILTIIKRNEEKAEAKGIIKKQ